MRISTNQFLLGSLNELLAQQANVNRLNRQIATGQSMLDASSDPAGAARAIAVANTIGQLSYESGNAQAATRNLQNGVSVLQQVTSVLSQLRQTAAQAANGTNTIADRRSLAQVAQNSLQQLVQLANTQGANGSYLFAGSKANAAPFAASAGGQIVFNGDAAANVIEIAPSLNVASSVSGYGIFMNIPAGNNGVAVSAAGSNTGGGYAVAQGVTSLGQLAADALAGTQYSIAFTAGSGGGVSYTVASGTGSPGSAGFIVSSGTVASGSYAPGSDLQFGGIDIRIAGTPAAGDSFAVQPAASTSIFQIAQDLVTALETQPPGAAGGTLVQQQIESVLASLDGAQNSVLSAQATLGSSLAQILAAQSQNATLSTNAQAELSNLQSVNLPEVLAHYSESVTALQAAQLAFARVQNLTLFSVIGR